MLNIAERHIPGRFAFFELAFRPFFLLAPLMGITSLALWLLTLVNLWPFVGYWHGMDVHSHEMIFGFAGAVVAGFLLTAARNWTGRWTWRRERLAFLVLVWLSGRILIWFPVPKLVVALLDLAFIPLLAVALLEVLWPVRQYRNLIFLPVLFTYWLGNLLMHGDRLGWWAGMAHHGLYLGLDVLLLLITIIGGRVIPFFTERGLNEVIPRSPGLDVIAILSMVAFLIVHQISMRGGMLSLVAFVALVVHMIRCRYWWHRRVVQVPLLWSLHFAYWWMVLGLGLIVLDFWWPVSPWLPVHAFTVGTVSGMILAMMARVSLGHTGRLLSPPSLVVAGFFFIQGSTLLRVLGPLFMPESALFFVTSSGVLWIMAMLTFVVSYGSMLVRPRADGLPG